MSTAYCVKCQKKVSPNGIEKTTVKDGNGNKHKAEKGKCPHCKTKTFRFLKG